MIDVCNAKICIVGLGYVGLPLSIAFAKKEFDVTGFDINVRRIEALQAGFDETLETSEAELKEISSMTFTSQCADIAKCDVFIVCVPTPIDQHKTPDLSPLENASELVGLALNSENLVIFESTVYPGATEEICLPILEQVSGLKLNQDFYLGYSPERINPGDKSNSLADIVKVTSGSTPEAASLVAKLYESIITAGVHRASSIKIAEAAKVIENTQRDLNIALMNELAVIFEMMELDTNEVLAASGTKWNFLPFRPGLVGGHCIGVDPYYLTFKATSLGYHPEVILSGRRINDNMGVYVVSRIVKLLNRKGKPLALTKVLVLGVTFKENCPDTRNSLVINIIRELQSYEALVYVYDPIASRDELQKHDIQMVPYPETDLYDAIIVAVAHDEFVEMGSEKIRSFAKNDGILFDVKSIFDRIDVDGRL